MNNQITVIIPAYNSHKTIRYTLDSLLTQSNLDILREIIVVDCSDNPESLQILEEYKGKNKLNIVHLNKKTSPAVKRNIGAKLAKTEILAFLDSDAFVDRDWLYLIKTNYDSGILFASGSIAFAEFQKTNQIAMAEYFVEFWRYMTSGGIRKKAFVPSCNIFCDKRVFNKAGGFPEVNAKCEDSLFCKKVNKITDIYFIPEIKCYHICRDELKYFCRNLELLGCGNIVYRRIVYKSLLYRGIVPLLLIPVILLVKLSRVILRILKLGNREYAFLFIKVLPFILLGLLFWGFGFAKGVCKDERF